MSRKNYTSSVRLTEAQRQNLLNHLDRAAATGGRNPANKRPHQRKDKRYEFRQTDIAVMAQHPGGSLSRMLVCSRNLSAGGMSFFHGGFLHPATGCKLVLRKLDGQPHPVSGLVVNCRLVDGSIHEVGIKFDNRLDPSLFVRDADQSSPQSDATGHASLSGKVLHLDDSKMEIKLLGHHLRTTSIDLKSVQTVEAALAAAPEKFDVFICDLNISGVDGVEAIAKVKAAGFAGPIVLLTAETDTDRVLAATTAAETEHLLTKPYEAAAILELLARLLSKPADAISSPTAPPIYSSMGEQSDMAEMLVDYVDEAKKSSQKLEAAMQAQSLKDIREICLMLKGSAPSYGFKEVADAAADALTAVAAAKAVEEASARLRELLGICARLSPGTGPPPTPHAA